MKFQANKATLAAAVEKVRPAASSRSRTTAGCVRIVVGEGVEFCVDGRDITIRHRARRILASAEEDAAGATLVPVNDLVGAIAAMSDHAILTVEATTSERGCHTVISDSNRRIELIGPRLGKLALVTPEPDGKIVGLAQSTALGEALRRASLCASRTDAERVVRGVALTLEAGSSMLEVVATDRRRLVTCSVPMGITARTTTTYVLPHRIASFVGNRLRETTAAVVALYTQAGRKGLGVRCGFWTAWIRLTDGVFPAWRDFTPDAGVEVCFNGLELAGALSTASKVAAGRPATIRFTFAERCRWALSTEVASISDTLELGRRSDETPMPVSFELDVLEDLPAILGDGTLTARLNATSSVFQAPGRRYVVLPPVTTDDSHPHPAPPTSEVVE